MSAIIYNKEIPKYIQMKQIIIDRIASGIYPENFKLKPRKELAKEYNLTVVTCSRAIDELLSEGVLESKIGIGTFVASRSPKAEMIDLSVVVRSYSNPIYSKFANLVNAAGKEHNFLPGSSYSSDGNLKHETATIRNLLNKKNTYIFLPDFLSPETRQLILNNGDRFYIFGTAPELAGKTNIIETTGNGGKMAVDYLIDKGHQAIGYLGRPVAHVSSRYDDYIATLRHYGLKIKPEWIGECNPFENLSPEEKDKFVINYLQRNIANKSLPSAIICFNDHIAIHLLGICHKLGISVPDEISIFGYDGALIGLTGTYNINTICKPYKKGIELAVQHILHGDKEHFISPRLEPSMIAGNTVKELCPVVT